MPTKRLALAAGESIQALYKWLLWGALSVAWATAAAASQSDNAIVGAAGQELRLPLGARPAATGGAFAGQADDLNALEWNPAGLAQLTGVNLGFLHNIYFQGISTEYAAYAQNLFPGAGLGFSFAYFNYGSLEKVSDAGLAEGSYTPATMIAALSYGQWLSADKLAAGGALKLLNQTIDSTKSALAADLSLLCRPGIPGLQLGLVLQNLGTQISGYDLPLNLKAGAAYALPIRIPANDDWRVLLDVNAPLTDTHYLSVNAGMEYCFAHILTARLGYTSKDTSGLTGLTGLTAGFGVSLAQMNLDYALVTFGDLGLTHQIMLSATFGKSPAQPAASPESTYAKKTVNTQSESKPEKAARKEARKQPETQETWVDQKIALETRLREFKQNLETGKLPPIAFKKNKAILPPGAYQTLDELGRLLAPYANLVVSIENYTDNQTLSWKRARAICNYLTSKNNTLHADHLIPVGGKNPRPAKGKRKTSENRIEFVVSVPAPRAR